MAGTCWLLGLANAGCVLWAVVQTKEAMSDDPFRQWVRREVSELDHMANKHDPQFLAFLAGVIGEKVDFPPVCSFYSQALQISKSLGLSMSYEHIFRSRLEPLNKRGLTR